MPTILDAIVAKKREEIAAARALVGAEELARRYKDLSPVRDFEAALRAPGMRIIAEIKKASPSAGVIRADFDPVAAGDRRLQARDTPARLWRVVPG